MITIDGSFGEGGGQILRTSLSLSLLTGKAFRMEKIRAGRKNPGLLRQHLTAVSAAVQIGKAEATGATIGSTQLTFIPGEVQHGDYEFAIGTAGSTTLVLQTVLPALLTAAKLQGQKTTLTLEGGTHNPFAPPFDFLDRAFLPLLRRMGAFVEARLIRPGFYPAGGGRIEVEVYPSDRLHPIDLCERGKITGRRGRAFVASLPRKIAEREISILQRKLSWPQGAFETVEFDSAPSPGNFVTIEIETEALTEVFSGFGERGVPAEEVADRTVQQARRYLASQAAAGEYLADQLLIPMAIAGSGVFSALPPSRHTTTNIEIIKKFLDINITAEPSEQRIWTIRLSS